MNLIKINCDEIIDWDSFHGCFKQAFGFPDFYGRNMNAWIDCMTYLDDDFSAVQIEEGSMLTLALENLRPFKQRCPEIYARLIECAAFVNYRRIEQGQAPILVLSFYD